MVKLEKHILFKGSEHKIRRERDISVVYNKDFKRWVSGEAACRLFLSLVHAQGFLFTPSEHDICNAKLFLRPTENSL